MDILHEILGPRINVNQSLESKTLKTIEFEWDSGGWNNIILALEVMICLACKYNRALVIPKASNWYLLDGDTHLFDFYDEETFRSFVPTSSMPCGGNRWTAQGKFIRSDGRIIFDEIDKQTEASSWYFPSSTRMLSHFSLAFPLPIQFYPTIHSALRIKTSLIDMAINLMKSNDLELGKFIALHVRRNDFQYKKVAGRSNQEIVKYILGNLNNSLPILIISDIFDAELIREFESNGNRVVCWSQKKENSKKISSKYGIFIKTSSKDSIVSDMICASAAKKFFGSPLSTFSSRICHWRGLLSRKLSSIDDGIYYTMPWELQPMYWNYVDRNYWKSLSI